MKSLTFKQKLILTAIESLSVFLTTFLNQMVIILFPSYESVKIPTNVTFLNSTNPSNCNSSDPSNSYVAILLGCKSLSELFMLPLMGLLVDHHDPPRVFFFGLLIEGAACLAYGASGNFYLTMLTRVLDGIGNSVVSTAGLTIIYNIYAKDNPRIRVISLDSIMVYVAACVSPIAGAAVFEALLDRGELVARFAAFMLVGPLFLFCALLALPFAFPRCWIFSWWFSLADSEAEKEVQVCLPLEEDPSEPVKEVEIHQSLEKGLGPEEKNVDDTAVIKSAISVLVLLRDRHIMLIIGVLTTGSLMNNSLQTTIPIFMIMKFCSDQRDQGIVWLFGIVSLLGFVLSTYIFHKRPSVCWIFPLLCLLVNGIFSISIFFVKPWWVIGVVIGTMSFFSSMSEVILIPLVPKIIDKRYPKSRYGSSSGLTLVTYTIGELLGTFPVGPLVDRFDFFVLCVILCAINVCLAPFMFGLRTSLK